VTSEARQAAGRANGRAGGGRKSAAGKASSARNAFRHGLSVAIAADPAASAELAALTNAIAPPIGAGEPDEDAAVLAELARRIAEAQLDLVRVRRVRHDLIRAALADPDGVLDGLSSRVAGERARLLHRAEAAANHRGPWASLLGQIVAQLRTPRSGPAKLARILGDLAPRLAAMDRYEGRARSRRMRASVAYERKKMFLRLSQSKVVYLAERR
jgi:hypothetical protein